MKGIRLSKDERNQRRFSLPFHSPLSSRQVTARLVLGFSMLAVLLISIGDMGLRRMSGINAGLEETLGRQWTKMSLSRETAAYSNRNSRIMMQVFLLKDGQQIGILLNEREENSQKIAALIAELKGLCESEQERLLLAKVEETRNIYIESYLRGIHLLMDEKNVGAAASIMTQQATPALLRYHAAWDEFAHFQGEQLETQLRQSKQQYAAARRLALLIIIVAVMVPCALALFAIRHMVYEITIRLRDEKESLRTAHQEAEVFINAVPSILIGLGSDLGITRWNSAAVEAFGLTEAEVAGKQLTECGIRWLRPDMQNEIQSWSCEHSPRRCDQLSFEINGGTRLLGLTITPVQVADGSHTKLLIIGTDTTARSVMEEQLRQAQKLESIGQLAAGIAHEINTPTQYIGDNVRFLKDAFEDLKSALESNERLLRSARGEAVPGETEKEAEAAIAKADVEYLSDEVPKAIDQALEGVARVAKLVSAMRDFSHPDTKEKVLLDLNHAIDSTVTVARNEWKYVSDVETDFDASLPLFSCLPGEFNQVILNLIVNAAHAIGDVVKKGDSEKGKIKVQTRACPEWVEIRIQDTGSGIPEKVRARIFDPFFTTKEIGKGTGQGLAIARSVVVDKHGGSIHFETEEGKGTTFIIRLPFDGKAMTTKAVAA
jgi:signal transduction histidine kinase